MARKKQEDIDLFHGSDLYIPTRTIWIGSSSTSDNYVENSEESGVDHVMAERVIKNIHILESLSKDQINIIMNCIGGDVFHGMAIYDAIKESECPILMRVKGTAASMGSIILQAADRRVLSKHSVMMIHHGYDTYGDHVKTVRSRVDFGKKYDKILNDIYLEKIREKHPDFTGKKLDKLLDFDTYLMPNEAIELGLADEVE